MRAASAADGDDPCDAGGLTGSVNRSSAARTGNGMAEGRPCSGPPKIAEKMRVILEFLTGFENYVSCANTINNG